MFDFEAAMSRRKEAEERKLREAKEKDERRSENARKLFRSIESHIDKYELQMKVSRSDDTVVIDKAGGASFQVTVLDDNKFRFRNNGGFKDNDDDFYSNAEGKLYDEAQITEIILDWTSPR